MAEIVVDKIAVELEDKASASAHRIENALGGMSGKAAASAKSMLMLAAGAVGVGVGFGALARKIFDANMSLAATQKKIAGTLFAFSNFDKGTSAVDRMSMSMGRAKDVTDALEETESRLAMPLEELGFAYSRLAGPALQKLGLSQKQLLGLTERSAEAAKVFGISGEFAASSIARALMTKTVRGIDPFNTQLRLALGNTKKLSSAEMYDRIKAKLSELGPAAEMMSKGMGGTLFRLRDFFEDTLRDVGKPTFDYIAQRLESWRKSLMGATNDGKSLVQVFGDKLLSTFKTIEKITTFVAEHWRTIAMFLATKSATGFLGGLAGGLAGAGAGAAGAAGAVGSGGALGAASAGLPLLAFAAQSAADAINDMHSATVDNRADMEGMKLAFKKLNEGTGTGTRQAIKIAKAFGAIDAQGRLLTGRMKEMLDTMSQKDIALSFGFLKKGSWDAASALKWFADAVVVTGQEMGGGGTGETDYVSGRYGTGKMRAGLKPNSPVAQNHQNFYGDINITQDFKEADPDRVFIRFKQGLENAGVDRLQANTSPSKGST